MNLTAVAATRALGIVVASAALTAPALVGAAPVPSDSAPIGPGPASPVIRDCLSKPTVRPDTVYLACADANARVVGITWDSWTAESAVGTGTLEENDCTPTCARGKRIARPVTVNAHTPVGEGADLRFSVLTYGAPGDRGNDFRDAQLPR